MWVDQKIASAAERFIRSRTPMLYMANPGCKPLAINSAHHRDHALRFPGSDALKVESVEGALKVLRAVLAVAGEPDSPASPVAIEVLSALLRSIRCYCGKILAILALRMRDCPFEQGLDTFHAYNYELESLPGWEFNLVEDCPNWEPADANERLYRISRIHMRLIAAVHSDTFANLKGVLEVRLLPSRNLRMAVVGIPGDELSARVELLSGTDSWTTLFETGGQQIDRGQLREYAILESHLKESLKEPFLAKEILKRAGAEIGDQGFPNYPVDEIIESLFDDLPEDHKQAEFELQRRLRCNLRRLYDAPVVAGEIRSALDRLLWEPSFVKKRWQYPLEVQADLADLRMPLVKLESAERFEGAFAVARP